MKGTPKIVFKREEVRSINNAWTECPFNKSQLDQIFDLQRLSERTRPQSFDIDVADKIQGQKVFNFIASKIREDRREREKQM